MVKRVTTREEADRILEGPLLGESSILLFLIPFVMGVLVGLLITS